MATAKAPRDKALGSVVEPMLEPVYVWDLVVRATHWLIVFSIIVLAVTGIYLGHPFVATSGPAREHFVTGYAKVIHAYAAIVFTLAVASRIVWMVIGPRRTNWRQFIPTSRRRRRGLIESLKFYTFLQRVPPPVIGHNPLAGLTYVAVFGLYLVMIATGFAIYSVDATSYMHVWRFLLPIFHGVQGARWIHHVVMWLLLGFVVHHIFSALLVSRVEKNGTLDSIFSGYKFLPKDRIPDDDADE